MSISPFIPVLLATVFALISLGGAFYEFVVVDPFWPQRPDIVQPQRGGISRKRFWIPAHVVFELSLVVALIIGWSTAGVRIPLLVGLASHAVMRIWSAFDFIPKALAYEKADPAVIDPAEARSWSRRSKCRLPLDLVTCTAMVTAFIAVVRLG